MFYGCHIWSQEQLKVWLWSQRSKKGRISQNRDVTCDCVQICFRYSFSFFFSCLSLSLSLSLCLSLSLSLYFFLTNGVSHYTDSIQFVLIGQMVLSQVRATKSNGWLSMYFCLMYDIFLTIIAHTIC